jgi:hypothetical protein
VICIHEPFAPGFDVVGPWKPAAVQVGPNEQRRTCSTEGGAVQFARL